MTLIRPEISRNNINVAAARWSSGSADNVSWFFSNGRIIYGPIFLETVDRSMPFRVPKGRTTATEIHDFDDEDITPDAISVEPNTRPTVSWNGIDNTEKYIVYHSEAGGAESALLTVAGTDADTYEIEPTNDLNGAGGVWHLFRVESVDQYGNESARGVWRVWVYDTPDVITGLTVENGSGGGLFDITIEA